MSPKKCLILALVMLLLAALACDYLPNPDPTTPVDDVIATSVAATLAAAGESPTADPAIPTDEPAPEPPPFLRIAFVKDGDVWYWEEGGAAAQLTALGDVVNVYLSGDGQVVAFVRQFDWNNLEIHAVNTDGTNIHPLVTLADFATMITIPDAISAVPYRIAWVPGTHTLAFNTRMTFEGPGLILPDELRLVDADSGTLSLLMAPGTAGDFYFSPDGTQIALVNATMVSVVNSDGSNRRDVLTFPFVITYSEFAYYPPVVWSPDSAFMLASIPPADPLLIPPDPSTVWHISADGSGASPLMTFYGVPFSFEAAYPSPDMNKVAYLDLVTPGAPPIVDLHVSNADGSGDVIYDSGDRQFESWSTTGEYFIFTESGHNPKLGRVGDPPLDLTGITLLVDVSWVDETRFLYLDRLSGSWELWLRELGTPGTLLASTTGESINFDFVK